MAKELYYYTAGWCESCQTLGPIMEKINRQIPVRKQNIDYIDEGITQAANVRNIPTVILVENGQELKRFVGLKSETQIITWLNEG
jgi:thioredoxin-like negative regulator of GroEL